LPRKTSYSNHNSPKRKLTPSLASRAVKQPHFSNKTTLDTLPNLSSLHILQMTHFYTAFKRLSSVFSVKISVFCKKTVDNPRNLIKYTHIVIEKPV